MNARISRTATAHAGSSASRMWFELSSSTSRASGISPATSTAFSNVVEPITDGLQDQGRRRDPRDLVDDVDGLAPEPARDRVLG